jgi:hypothetical protein
MKGAQKALLVDRLAPHMAVEVAVRTFGETKWPVNVDAELFVFLAR